MAEIGAAARAASVGERELVDRARAADPDAFAALYRLHLDRIHAFCWRRAGSRDVAEDVTAATFERALRNLHQFRWRGPGSFGSWLYRIAAHELVDHHRREQRHRTPRARAAAWRLAQDPAVDPAEVADAAGAARPDGGSGSGKPAGNVRAALAAINPRYERALILRYLSGLTHEEAAAAMGLSTSTMAVVVHRATTALRKAMEGTSAAAGLQLDRPEEVR